MAEFLTTWGALYHTENIIKNARNQLVVTTNTNKLRF